MGNEPRRRRRVRGRTEAWPGSGDHIAADDASTLSPSGRARSDTERDEPRGWLTDLGDSDTSPAERGLRGLIGGGSSQVSPAAAMRARDAARPRAEDLAYAEAELVIIRRHWTPRE